MAGAVAATSEVEEERVAAEATATEDHNRPSGRDGGMWMSSDISPPGEPNCASSQAAVLGQQASLVMGNTAAVGKEEMAKLLQPQELEVGDKSFTVSHEIFHSPSRKKGHWQSFR